MLALPTLSLALNSHGQQLGVQHESGEDAQLCVRVKSGTFKMAQKVGTDLPTRRV